jgi:hypothetical protein
VEVNRERIARGKGLKDLLPLPVFEKRLAMKRGLTIGFAIACLISTVVSIGGAQTQGMLPTSPAPVGFAANSQIQCGGNPVSLEPYDVKVTVLQVIRGKEAWERIQAVSPSNQPAKAGFDYVLALVSLELKARVSPGDKSFELGRPMQLTAMSADGREYEGVSVVPPKPELSGALRAGGSVEGWVAFLVDQKDRKPLMAFDPASGGATLRGKVLWFQLY